jgi:hypothetical protein
MPYALFCNDAKLSNAYPTEADVWKFARKSGLVIDAASEDDRPAPRPVLAMTVRSGLAGRTRRRTQRRIRPTPSVKPSANCNLAFQS